MEETSHRAGEAVPGLFRARKPPVWLMVLGSPHIYGGACTRGYAAKRGSPRATDGRPLRGLQSASHQGPPALMKYNEPKREGKAKSPGNQSPKLCHHEA